MTAGNTYSIRGFGGAGVPGALGDIRIRGNEGWYGIRLDWEWFAAGRGGGTIYGGSHGTVGIDQEGSDGGGIGAGGGGAGSFENDHTGGAGHDGGVIITEYSNASASSTESGAEDATDDADYPVTISDGVIADFGAHRHLLVSGTGPLVGVDATGLIACTLLLSFTAACVVTAMGSPTSGSAIKTPRFGADTPQDLHVQADDVVEIRLRADAETPFWKVVGGSFT